MTPIGLQRNKVLILDKDSSILGYPGEISKALHADHHGVCKFDSPQDPIYVTVRNVLKSLVRKLPVPGLESEPATVPRDDGFDAEHILGITEAPDTDYSFFRGRWSPGTCRWILENEVFNSWKYDPGLNPRVLWLHGSAASGKSVLASFIINHLVEARKSCQYFFIRFGDKNKRSTSTLLRSLALQIAAALPEFRQKLALMSDDIARLKNADVQSIWQKLFRSVLFKITLSEPLYWVIDGLEESDAPRTILKLMSDVLLSPIQIRILIVSRKTQEISSTFHKVFSGQEIHSLANEGQEHDFHQYIDQELNIPNDSNFKAYVAREILEHASGNFLWVHLAIQKINKCVTKADVRKAFEQLPPGMEALYGRMAQSVADIPEEHNHRRACDILAWATCATRNLSAQELCQALETDDEEIIDLPKSNEDLCGGFVVVDSYGNVTMIHQTAREYLLGNQTRPFNINRQAAHEQLFERCMLALMENGLRARINRGQQPAFMSYATTEWFRHLCDGAPISQDSMSVLMRFLRGSPIPVWIQALASREQLRVLISASTYLSKFAEKLRTGDLSVVPSNRQIPEREMVEKWSADLVKVVGKFGANLSKHPESIYTLIPPFCPQDSIFYQQYGKRETRSLSVSGVSNTYWDDSLARLSFRSGVYATSIATVGAYIAVLDPAGKVLCYREDTFEESHQIAHGERIRYMKPNYMGTLLATYGYLTTKVFLVSNGKCIASAPNPAKRVRPQTIVFADDDTTLLVGFDDGRLRSLPVSDSSCEWAAAAKFEEQPLEGTIVNSPSCMAISPDGNQVALGYRGYPTTVWEAQGPEFVNYCSRRDAENAWGEVVKLNWHPHSGEVIGLYGEGVVFKWNPFEYDVEEIRTGGVNLVVSHDGNFFATGDATGNLKVFSTSDFCIVYQLAAQDPVLDMCFSPDSHRLYDVRGSFGNVWEPGALVRLSEMTERNSDNASDAQSMISRSTVPDVQSRNVDSITALAAHPNGRCYSLGTEDGIAEAFDIPGGKKAKLGRSRSYMTVEQMTWSPNGRYVAFADLSGRLFVKTAQLKSDISAPWTVEAKFEMPIDTARGAILQMLFHPDSANLLVYTSSTISVITISTKSVVASQVLSQPNRIYKWITHPSDHDALIAIGPGIIVVRSWSNLHETATFHIINPLSDQLIDTSSVTDNDPGAETSFSDIKNGSNESRSSEFWHTQETVDRVFVTPGKNYILVQLSHPVDQSRHRHKQVVLLVVAALAAQTAGNDSFGHSMTDHNMSMSKTSDQSSVHREELHYINLPEDLACEIETPLAFLSRDRLVFLDRNFWVCSWRLPLPSKLYTRRTSDTAVSTGGGTEMRQHYFLPGDWISPDCVALCTMTSDGTVLCPRNGEVAVIKCATLRN